MRPRYRFSQLMDRWSALVNTRWPRGVGTAGTIAVILASLAYGAVKGDHIAHVIAALKDARAGAANAAGFRIMSIALAGQHHISREDVLAAAGVTDTTSLLFLDVEQTRERLKRNPWIADGTVLELYVAPRLIELPLVVGRGAETRAKEFLALLDRYPDLRASVRATVLVGERRWNLRLKNGIDVRLPETDIAPALERLVALDKEKNLTTRDIVAIDLRLADRVTVRLSEAAAQARIDAAKDKAKKKGGSA